MQKSKVIFKKYIDSCWFSAESAYREYVNMNDDGDTYHTSHTEANKQSSLAFLSQAHNSIHIANLHYLHNFEELELQWFENLVQAFDRFNDEMLDSYSTGHSVQHTVIYFDEFKEAYKLASEQLP